MAISVAGKNGAKWTSFDAGKIAGNIRVTEVVSITDKMETTTYNGIHLCCGAEDVVTHKLLRRRDADGAKFCKKCSQMNAFTTIRKPVDLVLEKTISPKVWSKPPSVPSGNWLYER